MSKFEDLERLSKMLDEGKITQDEYERLKADLLAEPSGGEGPEQPMTGKPAGWYNDPSGKARHQAYWDGEKWTGQTQPNPSPTPSKAAKKATEKSSGRGCLLVVAIVIVLAAFGVCSNGNGADTDDGGGTSGHEAVEAYVICQQFVEDGLKAPSTAEFGGPYSRVTTHLGGGRYEVATYVDSENSFGAMIRTDFVCVVDHVSGDRYRLESLQMDE